VPHAASFLTLYRFHWKTRQTFCSVYWG